MHLTAVSEMGIAAFVHLKNAFVFLAKATIIEGKVVLQITDCSGPLVLNLCKLCLL